VTDLKSINNKNRKDREIIIVAGFFLTILYIILFKPVYNYGDAPSYIEYARVIAEKADTGIYLHRSPLYPWLLSFIIMHLNIEKLASIVVFFQYILVFISGYLIFLIIKRHFANSWYPIVTTLLFYLNFSVIFYGYMLLTEILTLFLFILTIYLFDRGILKNSNIYYIFSGVTAAFLCLCRFNTLPVILIFPVFLFLYSIVWIRNNLFSSILKALIFVIPVFIILNGYAYYNFQKNGFFGIFPSGGSMLVSRNALVSTIKGNEDVSDDSKPVLEIFANVAEQYRNREPETNKGSLQFSGREKILMKLYGGYMIYSLALPELCRYFDINPLKPEPEISKALNPFYKELRRINKKEVMELRFFSLLNSFRSSTSLVVTSEKNINLNKLPAVIIKSYKILIFIFSFFVFTSSIIYLLICALKYIKPSPLVLLFIFLNTGFIAVNFFLAVAADSNRYKFPSEPLVFFLGIYFLNEIYMLGKKAKIV